MNKWLQERKAAIGLSIAVLVAEFYPLLNTERQLTQQEWSEHTVTVLIAAAILAMAIGYFKKKK